MPQNRCRYSLVRKLSKQSRLVAACERQAAVVEGLERRTLLSGLSFATAVPVTSGGQPAAVQVADVNGDGRADVIAFNYNDTVSIFLTKQKGGSKPAITFADGLDSNEFSQKSFAVADLGNGKPDLIASEFNSNTVEVLMGNGDGTFSAPVPIVVAGNTVGVQGVAVADINNDGKPDLLTLNGDGSVGTLLGNGNGTFQSPAETSVFPSNAPKSFAVTDVNNDGNLDVIAFSEDGDQVMALLGNGDGSFMPAQAVAGIPSNAKNLTVANFNGDADLAFFDADGTVQVMLGNSTRAFASPTLLYTSSPDGGLVAGDFNADGIADILVSNSSGQALVILGNGDGTFQSPVQSGFSIPSHSNGIFARDVNGDGKPDLVAIYDNSSTIGVSVNETAGNAAPVINTSRDAIFTAGVAGSFLIEAAGTPAPAISVTGALPAGLSFKDNGNGTATISGTPGPASGKVYLIQLKASTTGLPAAMQTLTLTVDESPTITSINTATFTVGAASSFMVTTTGFPLSSFVESGDTLPAGITFTDNGDGTATFSGTPATGTGGTYALKLIAKNTFRPNASQVFTLIVNVPPAITSGDNATFTVGAPGSFSLAATGLPAPAFSLSGSATLPAGLTLSNLGSGAATISGTPAAGTGGVYLIPLLAKNGAQPKAQQMLTLTINEAPAIVSASSATFGTGIANTFTVRATGFPAAAIIEKGTLPDGVILVDNGDGAATLSGMPDVGAVGTYSIVYIAKNSVGSNARQTYTLTVEVPPAFTSPSSVSYLAGSKVSFAITTNGTLSIFESGPLPTGLGFVDKHTGNATILGTIGVQNSGNFVLMLTITDGRLTAHQALTLTVNQTPSITSAAMTAFTVGQNGSFTVASSTFPEVQFVESGTQSLPMGVTFVDNGNDTATLSGTPALGTGGVYHFSIVAKNGFKPNTKQDFTLTVNTPPTITSADTATFTAGAAGTFTISTTGSPLPTISETAALPAGMHFKNNGNGTATISGTPGPDSGGVYHIPLIAASVALPTAMQTLTLTVDQAPTIISDNGTAFTVGSAGSFTVRADGFPTPTLVDNDTLPSGITFHDNGDGTAILSGTPAVGTGGIHALTIIAKNTFKPNGNQKFTLTINVPPVITSGDEATFTVGVQGSVSLTSTGMPAAAFSTSTTLPAGLTLINNGDGTATISGTPAAGTGGVVLVDLVAKDDAAKPNARQTLTLTVNQAPAIGGGNAATFATGQSGTFTITTTGFPAPALTETKALPSGVTFVDNHNGTATLSGMPADGSVGIYNLVIHAKNIVSPNANENFTLEIAQPPMFTSANHVTFVVGAQANFQVHASGSPIPSLSISPALPDGIGIFFTDDGNGFGIFGGIPTAGFEGTYILTLKASTAAIPSPLTGTQTFTLTIAAPL